MNFNYSSVEKKAHRLHSPTTHRIYKFQLVSIRILLVALLFLICFAGSALYGAFRSLIDSAPSVDSIEMTPKGYTTTILNTDSQVIQTLVGSDANREYVSIDRIPANLQNSFIAIEDKRFWNHEGVDVQGILRALASAVANGGDFNQGASTLTQQLLKNQVFGGGEEKTLLKRFQRKIQEQYLAVQVEKKYDKQQILEYYLNTINLGQNTLGVQAAAKRYFNKDVSELSLAECAVLAGITQNPTEFNPISHPTKNRGKQITVLTYMKEQGYITSEEYNNAVKDDVYQRIQNINARTDSASDITSYFTDALIEQVIKDLKERLGYTETQAYNALYRGGLIIYSTQDSHLQAICDNIINNSSYYPTDSIYQLNYQLTVRDKEGTETSYTFESMKSWFKEKKNKKISQYYKKKSTAKKQIRTYKKAVVKKGSEIIAENINLVIQPQVSFVLMEQSSGNVKALCGGRGTKTGSRTLNRATGTTRQPGSTFKVLSTFLPALDTAGMTLASVQDDSLYYYPGTKRKVKNWYGASYRGLTSMRRAIADSMNVVAVKTLEDVGPKNGYDYLLNLGFTTLVDNYTNASGENYTDIALPMALGGLTKGVTNLELTAGFATIANGGTYHRPSLYTKILDHNGNLLLDSETEESQQVMKDSTAWLLTSALRDVVTKGTGSQLRFHNLDMPVAGKTGTSTDNKDLWFVGYTPYLTAGIWGGYDNGAKQNADSYHKEIWRTIMEQANADYHGSAFHKPSSVVSAKICTKCGKLAIDNLCNQAVGGSCISHEYFSKDSLPTENCDCHVRCKICKTSGHLAVDNCPADQIYTMVYLQKPDVTSATDQTSDAPLIIPRYLSSSSCEIHGR